MNPFAFPTGMVGAMGGGASALPTPTTTASADASRNSKEKGASKNAESSDPNFGGLGTLGVAASQAASLGMNQASKFIKSENNLSTTTLVHLTTNESFRPFQIYLV